MYLGLEDSGFGCRCFEGSFTTVEKVVDPVFIHQASFGENYEDAVIKLSGATYPSDFKFVFREDQSFNSYEKRGRFYEITDMSRPHNWNISKTAQDKIDSRDNQIRLITFSSLFVSEHLKKFEKTPFLVLGNRTVNSSWVIEEISPVVGSEQIVTLVKVGHSSYRRINHFANYNKEELGTVWGAGQKKVFVSHRDSHKGPAKQLAAEIEKDNKYTCFVAHESIEPNKEWQKEIEKALLTMDALVCFLTKDYYESIWTNQEVGFALSKGVPIFCYSHDNTDPKGFQGNIQAIKKNIPQLINVIGGHFL